MKRIQIERIIPFKDRNKLGIDRVKLDIDLQNVLNKEIKVLLENEDKIKVFSILDQYENIVSIKGSINRPGDYELKDSLDLASLINKANGIAPNTFLERVEITRKNSGSTPELNINRICLFQIYFFWVGDYLIELG